MPFRFLKHSQTVVTLRNYEEDWARHYFDVLVSDATKDWQRRSDRDRDIRLAHGIGEPRPYRSREEYRKRVRQDFRDARKIIDQFLARGILRLGPSCINTASLETLSERLFLKRIFDDDCWHAIRAMRLLPVVHQTTAHIGIPAGIKLLDIGSPIPMVELTSSFGVTIRQIFQLLVRRTFTQISDEGLRLGDDIYDVTVLQRHSRMLFHLLGIWIVGKPFPTPKIDEETRALAIELATTERLGEGHVVAWLMNGWCLFEALHEFSHILTGDWLRSPDTWTEEDEFTADRFAMSCLLMEEHPTIRCWMLWGAILFLNCLRLCEQAYGNIGHHPGADTRAIALYHFARWNLPPAETELFDFLHAMRALPQFAYAPTDFGAAAGDRFGKVRDA